MPTNDIKTVADGGTANVLSQAAYAALTAYLDAGFSSGIVPSNQINKTIRQSTLMAYILAQHIVNLTGLDVLDNGAPATILANLSTAIRNTVTVAYAGNPNGHVAGTASTAGTVAPSIVWDITNQIFWVCTTTGNAATAVWAPDKGAAGTTYCGLATGTANTIVLTPAVPVAAYTAGLALAFIVATTNTGAATVNASGVGPISIYKEGPTGPIALTGGELAAGNLVSIRHDGTRFQLTATELGTAALANASSLTGVVMAASGAFTPGHIITALDSAGTGQDSGIAILTLNGNPITVSNNGNTLQPGTYLVDTTGGAFSIKLSAVISGLYTFIDAKNYCGINNFTIDGNGTSIGNTSTNVSATFKADVSDFEFNIIAASTYWRLV